MEIEREELQSNDPAAALAWINGGRGAKRSGAGRRACRQYAPPEVTHVISVSQSVSQRGRHQRCMIPVSQSRTGT